MSSPKIYSASEMQDELDRAAFERLPAVLRLFPRDPRPEPEWWQPLRTGEGGGVTLPAGSYFVGDVATELPEEKSEGKDGFYTCEERGTYGKFTCENGDYAAHASNRVWVDYQMFGIASEGLLERANGNFTNGHMIRVEAEFRAGYDKATREFWVEVPGNAAASFRVKLRELGDYGDEEEDE